MKNFRSLELAILLYKLVEKKEIKGPLKEQLFRATSSIVLNLSEGNGRGSINDKRHFFQIAFGSLRECQVLLRILKINDVEIKKGADQLAGCIYRLLNSNLKASPSYRKSSDI